MYLVPGMHICCIYLPQRWNWKIGQSAIRNARCTCTFGSGKNEASVNDDVTRSLAVTARLWKQHPLGGYACVCGCRTYVHWWVYVFWNLRDTRYMCVCFEYIVVVAAAIGNI